MKIVKTAAAMAVAMSATSALAGSVAPVTVVEPMLIEDAPMGSGSGAWIIPLLLIGAIAFLAHDNNDDPAPTPAPAPP